jgi:hypothetical protein
LATVKSEKKKFQPYFYRYLSLFELITSNLMKLKRLLFLLTILSSFPYLLSAQLSVAHQWNEVLLDAIRDDFARPTVHARNLFHTSIAMYDAWAIFDEKADTYFLGKTVDGFSCPFDGIETMVDPQEAQEEAISYAAYRLLSHRFQNSPGANVSQLRFDFLLNTLGYDKDFTSLDYSSGSPAALGNFIAQQLIEFGLQDGSNEQNDYFNQHYLPVNPPLVVDFPGNPDILDPNRWQPLTLDVFIDQAGNPIPINTPAFLSPEWGDVSPFALQEEDLTVHERFGNEYWVYHDPGMPPQLDTNMVGGLSEEYKWGFALVAIWSSHLDPADGEMIDISPASIGNIPELPTDIEDYREFYDLIEGGDPSLGHDINPHTGQPYEPQMVPRADYGRVLAEFWADGPDSETPPGHWFTILNYVNEHPDFEPRFQGQGTILDKLEWDVKAYLILGGAMHDCAISAWGIKGWYDYIRPISAIRAMAEFGQSTDPEQPSYHPGGIPLVPGYIELVEEDDPLVGDSLQHLNKIKLYAWKGPDYIEEPSTDVAGVDWILAENWWPYQRPSFVTPPFAGYVSGHSTYSRAAAEVLTLLTGDPFFPGGMGEFEAPANEFLVFEDGPSVDITLQWATYRDASDQTSLSRIWGGIHPPADDIPGRIIGEEIGVDAFNFALNFFTKDEDNDGYRNDVDCDDNNPNINPGVMEICDGIDNDCSGVADDNITVYSYYMDQDEDGFGDSNIQMDTCLLIAPVGFVDNDLDCDDTNAAINPDAMEICDGIDNNCSGFVDDGLDIFTYFLDADQDGFGNAAIKLDTCLTVAPGNYVANALDCDDTNAAINPDAMEICDDIDNNCDGLIDEDLPLFTYYEDQDNDGFGDATKAIEICQETAPIGFVANNTDCDDTNAGINPDAIDLADNGTDEDCSGLDLFKATKIYPNPVTDILTIHFDHQGELRVQLISTDWRMVREERLTLENNTGSLDFHALAKGLYIIRFLNSEGEVLHQEKVVRQ